MSLLCPILSNSFFETHFHSGKLLHKHWCHILYSPNVTVNVETQGRVIGYVRLISCTPVQTICSEGNQISPPTSALGNHTNCRHAWLPHCSSCGYIQTMTSAVCCPNMCPHPVKPNHCVLTFIMKTLYLIVFQIEVCSPLWPNEGPDECRKCDCRLHVLYEVLL